MNGEQETAIVDTMNRVLEIMGSEMRRYRDEGQVPFGDLSVGERFVWGMSSDDCCVKTKTSNRMFRVPSHAGTVKGRCYTMGVKVLVRRILH